MCSHVVDHVMYFSVVYKDTWMCLLSDEEPWNVTFGENMQ